MRYCGRRILGTVLAGFCVLASSSRARATGVPISGFYPFAGISLTDKFSEDDGDISAHAETSYSGNPLSASGNPYFDIALIDTGAAASLLTSTSDAAFNVQGAGFRGTEPLTLGGATGSLVATINDPFGVYASGVGAPNRTSASGSPLALNTSLMAGQSNVSVATLPAESDLPNILGIPFSSQYATYIRNDQPQIFSLNGKTVRTPQIQFNALGSGGQGISRRVPITLDSPDAFLSPPSYFPNFGGVLNGDPYSENPTAPTVMFNGSLQPAAAYFVNTSVTNKGITLSGKPFLLDTGADISVVSEINAVNLGFDPTLDTPDFTENILGSGGTLDKVPGFYVDQLQIPAVGGTITLTHVPFIVLDFPNPAHVGNVAEGLIGMNALAGRNIVIDPNPATGSGGNNPSLYVSDPVTTSHDWSNPTSSGSWTATGNWNASGAPSTLWIANVRNVSGSAQEAVVSANSTVWELNVSGSGAAAMNVRIANGVTLSSFSGANIETAGKIELQSGTLDSQYVDIRGGTLSGNGTIAVGSGPIVGQVENHSGVVAPSDRAAGSPIGTLSIGGRFVNDEAGTLAIDLGGPTGGTQYDRIQVDNDAALDGTLAISLINLGSGSYAPAVGTTFTILTAGDGVGGAFASVQGPDGYNWQVIYLTNSAQLVVGNPGDFNNDGVVDASDYVVWRRNSGGPLNYQAWRSHIGVTYSGSGSSENAVASVPEPASSLIIGLAACIFALRSRRLVGSFGTQRR
ncbi:MAG TPA: retropepsin-like aspartic protease [Lacipirellulaceae bacterium]|nr:retropepsin-like aspartic protease [Lacipirellulaceae bacterium]